MLPGGPAKRAPKKKRSGFKPSAIGRAYAQPKYTPKPKPKPYRPTPKQVESARAQERAYKSQGKAVKKVAHVQKAQGVGRPTGGRTLVTRVEAAGKVKRGHERERRSVRAGRSGDRPYTDVERALNKRFRGDPGKTPVFGSRAAYQAAVKDAVAPAVSRAAYQADRPSRFGGDVKAARAARKQHEDPNLKKAYDLGYMEKDPKKLKAAGFAPPGLAEKIVSSPKYAIKYGIKPAVTDVAELTATTPSSLAKFGVDTYGAGKESYEKKSPVPLAKFAGKTAKETGEQYLDLAKHPDMLYKRPVTSALMLLPAARVPGLAAGKVARVTGKQTLRRPDVVLKGTALREQRLGSRDITVRALQSRSDRRAAQPAKPGKRRVKVRRGLEKTAPQIRVRAPRGRQMLETTRGGARRSVVQQRVDEFRDVAQHTRNEVFKKHAKAAQKKAKGKSKTERAAIFAEEREKAVEAADTAVRTRFVKEFGTTGRLSVDLGEVEAAKVEREFAGAAKKEAKDTVAVAAQRQAEALTEARVARAGGATRRSPLLEQLEREHKQAGRSKLQKTPTAKKVRETEIPIRHPEPGPREAYIAERPKPAAGDPDPTVEGLTKNLKPGKPGISIVSEHRVQRYRGGEQAGWGEELPRSKVVVARDKNGKPVGALSMSLDEHGQPTIMEVAVDPAHRGKGVASKLVKAAHDAGYDLARAAREGGLTEAGAALTHKNLAKRAATIPAGALKVGHYKPVKGRVTPEQVRAHARERTLRQRDLRQQIAQERKRISGVPPAQQDALLRANADLADARAAHADARAKHAYMAGTHKDLKKALANAELVEPAKGAQLYDSKAEATRVANLQEFDATTFKAGEQWGVVPKVAKERLRRHGEVGTSKALGARELRVLSRSFRNSVLPLSARWLFGQVSEATFRTALEHGFNPLAVGMSLARERAVYNKLEKMEPGLGKEMRARAVRGGQFGSTSIAREFMGPEHEHTIGEEFADSYAEGVGKAVSKSAQAPVVKQYRERVWHPYKHLIFNVVNGFVEESARRALTGRKIAQGPLMERRILTLTDRAVTDAAKGLKNTEAQVQLARAVDRAYGKYSKFGPDMRERLAHWTPFLPWYMNTAKFLFDVLPRDHPIITSLAANYSLATEDWRKQAGLSFHGGTRVPPWKLGTYKNKDGQFFHAGRYLPFSPGAPSEALGQAVFPQLLGAIDPLKTARDWKGGQIKGGELGVWREALQSGVEAHVPGASQLGKATGISEKLRGKEARGGSVIENLGLTQNPFAPIPEGNTKKKPKKSGKAPLGGGTSGGLLPLGGGSTSKLPLGGG